MKLIDQQRALRNALLSAICPPNLLAASHTPVEPRFAIYADAYRGRLIAALRDNYPVLAAVLGDDDFGELGAAYLQAHPSSQPSIRWFGDALHSYVSRQPEHLPHPALADLIRLEWALGHAFDAADVPPAALQALAACAPEHWPALQFSLHPSVTVLALEWAVEPLWHQLQADPHAECEPPELAPHELLVWRHQLATQFRCLAPNEAALLQALQSGETLGGASERVFAGEPPEVAAQQLLAALAQFVDHGALVMRADGSH